MNRTNGTVLATGGMYADGKALVSRLEAQLEVCFFSIYIF